MAEATVPTLDEIKEEKPAEMSEEQKFRAKFPTTTKPGSTDMLLRERLHKGVKYFDSGDYNMAKTNKRPLTGVGAAIPRPENLPHRKTSVPSKLASPTVSVQD